MLMPVTQFAIGITLLLFFASSFLGSFPKSSANFDPDSGTSFAVADNDYSPENSVKRRYHKRSPKSRSDDDPSETVILHPSPKRPQRGKPSLTKLSASDKPALAVSVIGRIRESFISDSPSAPVYQKINVYRI
jgi:hypothetical protein